MDQHQGKPGQNRAPLKILMRMICLTKVPYSADPKYRRVLTIPSHPIVHRDICYRSINIKNLLWTLSQDFIFLEPGNGARFRPVSGYP